MPGFFEGRCEVSEDIGVTPSGSGSRAAHGAADASPPKASIPDAESFDPASIAAAVSLVDATALQPIIRRAADNFYDAVYDTVENYLKENLDWNLTAHLEMLERENKRMRAELHAVDSIIGPPWLTPETRIEKLRELDRAKAELATLKYEKASPASGDGS